MRNAFGWAVLLTIGIVLIVAGMRGRIGSVIGALVTPIQLQDITQGG